MVTVVEYAIRQAKDGREFVALILQGGLCLVQSKQTNNYYATLRRCSVPSTFDEVMAKGMLGIFIALSVIYGFVLLLTKIFPTDKQTKEAEDDK